MNKLHLRYFLISLVATAAVALLTQNLIATILIPELQAGMAGAAYFGGWWGHLATSFAIALFGARKAIAAADLEDPKLGRVAGLAMGVWSGAGALFGHIAASVAFTRAYEASLRTGLIILLGAISMIVAIVAATITGRESAQPHEQEEA